MRGVLQRFLVELHCHSSKYPHKAQRNGQDSDAGVKGYLLKDTVASDLLHAIDAVRSGRTFFSPAIAQVLREDHLLEPRRKELPDPHYLLSEREKEILQLLAEGKSNKEVAAVLNVSPQTVETHRAIFMEKLNLHSAAEIVLYAVRKQMIP